MERLPPDDDFDRWFKSEMSGFRGTEAEIVVMKTVAHRWFRLGQRSVLSRAKALTISNCRVFDDLDKQLSEGGI